MATILIPTSAQAKPDWAKTPPTKDNVAVASSDMRMEAIALALMSLAEKKNRTTPTEIIEDSQSLQGNPNAVGNKDERVEVGKNVTSEDVCGIHVKAMHKVFDSNSNKKQLQVEFNLVSF